MKIHISQDMIDDRTHETLDPEIARLLKREPPPSKGILIFVVVTIAAILGTYFISTTPERPTLTNGEIWTRMCAVEQEHGSEQDRKDCVFKHAMQNAMERNEREYQQRLKAASSPYR